MRKNNSRNCIYQRGNSFQVKLMLRGRGISRTFRSRALAERFVDACRRGDTEQIERIDARNEAWGEISAIQQLYDRVDLKRWSGNSRCKAPTGGSAGNARRFVAWVGPRTPIEEALHEDTIWAFLEEREYQHENCGSTINRYIAGISVLATEALKLRLIPNRPEMLRRQEGPPRKRIFTEQEEGLLLDTLQNWGCEDYAALFSFLIDTGCRPGEAQQLLWSDFDGDKIHLEAEITKNSTRRSITATPRALDAVRWMRAKHIGKYPGPFTWAKPGAHKTRDLWDRLRADFDWMGKDCVPYSFRHTCASRLVQRGIDLYRVQIWLGHKGPQMTQRYAKFAPDHLAELAAVLTRPSASSVGTQTRLYGTTEATEVAKRLGIGRASVYRLAGEG